MDMLSVKDIVGFAPIYIFTHLLRKITQNQLLATLKFYKRLNAAN